MTALMSKILSDRALVRAFDDAQLKVIEEVLKSHLQDTAAPVQAPVAAAAAPAAAVVAAPVQIELPDVTVAETVDNRYVAYVDGACSGNPGPGAWAAFFPASGEEIVGSAGETTNNQMEIMAAAAAVRATPQGAFVEIFTDSQLVVETMRGNYKRKKNIMLWDRLDEACKRRSVTFTWVKGHNGDPSQERADTLAQEAVKRRKQAA